MDIDKYKNIEKIVYNKQDKKDVFALNVIQADKLFKLGNHQKSQSLVKQLLNECILEKITFNTLIKLSFLFGELSKIMNIIKENFEQVSKLDRDFFYIDAILRYCEHLKFGYAFPYKKEMDKANDNIKKSFIYYIHFLISKDKNEKLKLLDACNNENDLNMSIINEIVKYNRKLELNELKFALEIDKDILKKIRFCNDKDNLKLRFLTFSGGNNIGGSSYIIFLKNLKVMIDAGAIMSKRNKLEYPDFEQLNRLSEFKFNDLDYLIITHGHLDHCGAILEIYKRNPKIKILMTEETREIIRVNLTSGNLSQREEYTLDTCLNMAIVVGFRYPIRLNKDTVIEFFRAGHILGASSIYINCDNVGVFVTGDYCLSNQATLKGMDIPKNYKIDLLITETTYGNKQNEEPTSKIYERQNFAYTVKEYLKLGKKILIPSFSIGRAQEIITILRGKLNLADNERIYVDGMVKKINKIYEKFTGIKLRGDGIYTFDEKVYSNKKNFIKQEVLNNKSCVVASSGMLQIGSSVMEYVKEFLKRKDCVCILTGYQADDTVGRNLKSQINVKENRYISINEELIKIECELMEFNLSAHCSLEEILALVINLNPKKVLLVHGNANENQSYIHQLLNNCDGLEVVQAINNSIIDI